MQLNLVGWWGSRYEEPISLATSLANGYQACKNYRRRFQIETFFSDQKSRGFHLYKSHLSKPLRLSRLFLPQIYRGEKQNRGCPAFWDSPYFCLCYFRALFHFFDAR